MHLLTCVSVLAAVALAYGADDNLLGNAGFEAGTEGWEFEPGVAQPVADARTGAQALRLDCPADQSSVSASQLVSCEPGKRYRLSAWTKGDGRVTLQAWFKDAEGEDLPGRRPYVVGEGPRDLHDWSQSAVIIEPPGGCAQLEVALYLHLGNYSALSLGRARDAVFDDVALTVTEQTDNLVFNGDMELCTLPDVPDGWWLNLRGGPHPPSVYAPGRWGLDRENPWEGDCCLRSDIPDSDMRSVLGPCQGGGVHTFSVYLRADRPMQVSAYVFANEPLPAEWADLPWDVGTEWQRYTLSVEVPEGAQEVRVAIHHLPVEGTLWADAAQLEIGDTATPFHASLRDLPRAAMTEPAEVRIEIPAAVLDLLHGPIPGPLAGGGVQVDSTLECLRVDGEPFFGVGFGGVPPAHLSEMKAINANMVMPRGVFGEGAGQLDVAKSVESAHACLDRAAELDLKVILWMHTLSDSEYRRWYEDENRRAWLDGVIAGLKDHPALLAWKMTDEPHTVPAEWIERLYNFFRERDPDHPAFINLGAGGTTAGCIENYGPFGDLVSVDYYPVGAATSIEGVADFAQLLRRTQPSQPLHYWIQCFMGPSWLRCPTPAEETAMDYLSIIHGTTLISYFSYRPVSQVLWQHLNGLNAELRSLAEDHGLLLPPAPSDQTTIETDGVHVLVKGDAGRLMLVTVNAIARPAKVHFSVPGLPPGQVGVLFEDRTIEHGAEGFDDDYQPHERHVYVIE